MNTEDVSARHADLDRWPDAEIVLALLDDQLAAAAVARAAGPELANAAGAAAGRLAGGDGRLIYAGAGASGRLAVQDGVELTPTYGWPDDRLVYLMAGGEAALVRSVEGAEDDADGAVLAVRAMSPGPEDVLIGVAASGRTPWTVAAVRAAREAGALTVGIANNAGTPLGEASEHAVDLPTGAEVVAGSTRLAAGTAQKIALNTLSTGIMVRLGGTYGPLMVGLASANAKLDARRLRILRAIVPADEAAAGRALEVAGKDIRVAALILAGDAPDAARTRLTAAGGDLRRALEGMAR